MDLGNKDQMDIRINRHEGNNIYAFRFKGGQVALVIEPSVPGTDITLSPYDLFYSGIIPDPIMETIWKGQQSNEILTDVLNFDNNITTTTTKTPDVSTDNRIIREMRPDNNGVEKKVFKGPALVLVTLDPAKQLFVEWNTFDKMGIMNFNERYTRDNKFKNAYDYLTYRRDFRNSLALSIGAKDPYVSDIDLVNKIMEKLSLELKENTSSISEESIRILSHPQLPGFVEKISEIHPEYTDFYSLVKRWNENFAKYAMGVIYLDPKDETKEYKETRFLECLLERIEMFKLESVK